MWHDLCDMTFVHTGIPLFFYWGRGGDVTKELMKKSEEGTKVYGSSRELKASNEGETGEWNPNDEGVSNEKNEFLSY